jgi:hypothetical protein
MLCFVRYRSLQRADHWSIGVIPSLVCVIVKLKPRQWGGSGCLEALTLWKSTHQFSYNEIWGAFVQPVLSCKMSKYYISWVRVFILRYPACASAMRSVQLYNILPPYFIKGTILEKKKLLNVEVPFNFFYNFDRNISYPRKNWARCGNNMFIGLHLK